MSYRAATKNSPAEQVLLKSIYPLSGREIEVFHWVATGKSDWEISQILGISTKTVNFHVENVKRKFGVATRIQALVAVVRSGKLD